MSTIFQKRSAWQVFPLELLEIITYQLMWVAAATYIPILAPPNLLATMTGIAGASHYSLGKQQLHGNLSSFVSWKYPKS